VFIVRRLLARFGALVFYPFLAVVGLGAWSRRHWFRDRRPPEALRLFLQDVNGALLKLGQILAMRVEFLPDDYTAELMKLLDEVPPFDSELAQRIVERELGLPIASAFLTFEMKPIAAASFGQVHAATLPDGGSVVVKVRRPGIEGAVNADLWLFKVFAFLADTLGITGHNPLGDVYREFHGWTRDELDYRIEGSHLQEIYQKSNGWPTERIPKVYWSHTTARVLTMERLSGLWIKDLMQGLRTDRDATLKQLEEKYDTDLQTVSRNLLRNTLRQIFVYGVYHADPHAANLMVVAEGAIGYVDFGIVGRIGRRSKETQVRVHVALESGDFDEFYSAIFSTLEPPYRADIEGFKRRMRRSYDDWLNAQFMEGVNIADKSFARLMLRINFAAQQTGVGLRDVELRIFRALATIDAALLQLEPKLDVRSELRHFFGTFAVSQFVTSDVPRFLHSIPALLNRLSDIESHAVHERTHFSATRYNFGIAFQLLGAALLIICVLFVIPGVRRAAGDSLDLRVLPAFILLLALALVSCWAGFKLKLHSVTRRPVMQTEKVSGWRKNPGSN
jgi:ubiquinone biosynthesis protein